MKLLAVISPYITAISLFFTLTACGGPHERPGLQPRQVQTWDIDEGMGQRKRAIVKGCRDAGGDDARCALLVAMAMQETTSLKCADRDTSKDNSGEAKNVSCFNLNLGCLKKLGFDLSRADSLNDDANLAETAKIVSQGMDKIGVAPFLNFHRGGETAWVDGCSYGAGEYRQQMAEVQAYLLAHPEAMTNNQRIAGWLDHV